jgi:hypothetical protein
MIHKKLFGSSKSLAMLIIVFFLLSMFVGLVKIPNVKATTYTFGNTNIGGSAFAYDDSVFGSNYSLTVPAGQLANVTKISFYCYFASGSGLVSTAVYDNSSNPIQIKVSDSVMVDTTQQFWDFPINTTLTTGVYYLNFLDLVHNTDLHSVGNSVTNAGIYGGSSGGQWQNPMSINSYQNYAWSIYATYTLINAPTDPTYLGKNDYASINGTGVSIMEAIGKVYANTTANRFGNVYIPAGTFSDNYTMHPVVIPAGINVYGASPWGCQSHTASWTPNTGTTILNDTDLPTSTHTYGNMFLVDGYNTKKYTSVTIANIEFIGGNVSSAANENSNAGSAISISQNYNFTITNCTFINWCNQAVGISANDGNNETSTCYGVLSNCVFDNPYKNNGGGNYVWGYGVIVGGNVMYDGSGNQVSGHSAWISNASAYFGYYGPMAGSSIVYIEDCHFSNGRHNFDATGGGYFCARFNLLGTPACDYTAAAVDVHGAAFPSGRGMEAYNNTIIGAVNNLSPWGTTYWSMAVDLRGGSSLIFNNTFTCNTNSANNYFLDLTTGDYVSYLGMMNISSTYIWGNTYTNCTFSTVDSGIVQNRDYFLYAMPTYTSNTYPEPTLGQLLTDTTSPTYSSLSYSTTVAGASCHFNATVNDNLALQPNGRYQFGTNNSGSWVWDSTVNFTSTPQTVSVSKTLNTTAGVKVSYQWNITDNAGNSNSTGIQTITITTGSLDHIVISPSSATITSGGTQAYSAIAYDIYNNSLGTVTSYTSWSINASAGGSWNSATYTSRYTGTWIVVGTYSGKQSSSTLTVNAGTAYSITVSPSSATITAGTQKTYTATAYDSQGNNLGTVTASWSIASGASGSWSSNIYTSHTAGSWTVTATYSALQGTASLTVNVGNAYTVTVSPSSSTINMGQQQAYSAIAYDNQGNSLGTVTNSASWSISSGAGGSWSGAVYTSQNSGTFTVTATYSAVQGTATLTVSASIVIYTITATSDAHSTISPSGEYSVFSGNNQAFTFSAYTGYYVSQVLVDSSPVSTASPYTFTAVSANHTITVYSTLTPTATPTPTPTTLPINRPTETLRLYLRSDTYNVTGISAYGLDTDYTNAYSQISISVSGTANVTYGFRIYLVTSATLITELTSGAPTALIYLTGNFTGQLSSSWTCPDATILLGYQALKVDVYVSTDNTATWTAQAVFITNVLMTTKLTSSTWIFALNVNMTQTTSTACSFSFGDTDHRSTISNVIVQQPLESELQNWRISRGDYVGFELGAYVDKIGEAFYVLLLLLFAGALYFRYGHFGVVAFFFVLFGGTGGLVWLLVPPWAAAAVSALVIIGTSLIVWRVIR